MINIKLYEIPPIDTALDKLMNMKWNANFSYKLAELQSTIKPHHERLERTKNELILKFAKKDKKGKVMRPKDSEGQELASQVMIDNTEQLQIEMMDLLQEEIEISLPVKIKLEDFKEVEFEGNIIRDLRPILSAEEA